MKKHLLSLKNVWLLLVLSCLLLSCNKTAQKESLKDYQHKIVPIEDGSKSNSFMIATRVGHLRENCKNGCVSVGGQKYHADCRLFGNYCLMLTQVTLSQFGAMLTATTIDSTELTSDDFYMIPDRSLYAGRDEKGNDLWLNIPEQTSYRDSVTRQFTFTGLYYSNSQVYQNL